MYGNIIKTGSAISWWMSIKTPAWHSFSTVIMIAHRLSTVVGADKILVLEGGRVVEQGSHRELVETGGLYTRMWADYNQSVQWKITSEEEAK